MTARRQQTRGEIVVAAWELARRNGLAGITLRDLAAAVGMKAPSIYTYFTSKHEIYDAMFAEGYRSFAEVMGALPTTGPDRSRVVEGLTAYFEFATADPERFQLLFLRTIPGFEPSAASYALAVEALDALTGHLASVGVHEPRDVDLWTAVATGLASQHIANPTGRDWRALVERTVDILLPATSTRHRSGKAPR